MDFDAKVWRNYYDQVKILGQYLIDSRPDEEGNPPKFTIPLDERREVEKDINHLLKNCDKYLDKCKLHPKDSLWYYDRNNQTTWLSSESFKFANVMSKKRYMTVAV